MPTKHDYTVAFATEAHLDIPIEQAFIRLWHNVIANSGLRLTHEGYLILTQDIGLHSYDISIQDVKLTNKFYLDLDRYIKTPYYINIRKPKRITLFDQKMHFALTMYGGDFEKFCNAHKL